MYAIYDGGLAYSLTIGISMATFSREAIMDHLMEIKLMPGHLLRSER